MRSTFIRTLTELAERDPRVVLLTADLGFMVIEPFVERCPNQFFNVGVAEQNMVGLATGLAEAGFIPFVYSIGPFAALRPYEFIRNGPIMHQLPVRIVSVGAGMEYASNGLSHYAIEDIALMRAQPGIAVIGPADYQQAQKALLESWNLPGPIYYRLGKDDKTIIPGLDGQFELGKAKFIRSGKDILLVSTGSITLETLQATDILAEQGIEATVMVISSIQPLPLDDLVTVLRQFPAVVTVEAHYINGGIGSLVAEVIAEYGLPCRLTRCGIRKTPRGVVGSQGFMYESYGISALTIAKLSHDAVGIESGVLP